MHQYSGYWFLFAPKWVYSRDYMCIYLWVYMCIPSCIYIYLINVGTYIQITISILIFTWLWFGCLDAGLMSSLLFKNYMCNKMYQDGRQWFVSAPKWVYLYYHMHIYLWVYMCMYVYIQITISILIFTWLWFGCLDYMWVCMYICVQQYASIFWVLVSICP